MRCASSTLIKDIKPKESTLPHETDTIEFPDDNLTLFHFVFICVARSVYGDFLKKNLANQKIATDLPEDEISTLQNKT